MHHRVLRGRVPTGAFLGLVLAGGAAAVIGGRQDILGFSALGFTVLEAADTEAAREALRRATAGTGSGGVSDGGYAVIFITEAYAAELADDISKFDDAPTPAILPIPSASSDVGFGMKALHDRVKRAVGSDIL